MNAFIKISYYDTNLTFRNETKLTLFQISYSTNTKDVLKYKFFVILTYLYHDVMSKENSCIKKTCCTYYEHRNSGESYNISM